MCFSIHSQVGSSTVTYWSWALPLLRAKGSLSGGSLGPLRLGLLWNRATGASTASSSHGGSSADDVSDEGTELLTEDELRSCRDASGAGCHDEEDGAPAPLVVLLASASDGMNGVAPADGSAAPQDEGSNRSSGAQSVRGGGVSERLGLLLPPPPRAAAATGQS